MKLFPAVAGAVVLALGTAPAQAQQLSRTELTEALKKRDVVIAALEARVAALEAEMAAKAEQVLPPAVATPPLVSVTTATAPATPATAQADDEANLEALSQILLQRGGLVLPPWRYEVIESAAYSNRIVQGLALVQTPEGIPTVADQRLREDQFRASLALRLGLPLSSQIEVFLPYNWIRRSRALGDGSSAVNKGYGIGDLEVALSHQFLREKDGLPALIGGVSWRIPTGEDPFKARLATIATGSGTHQLRGRLTAVKSIDPVVFFGTMSYAHEFATTQNFGRVQTGDAYGLQLGMALALNPDTSMTFGLNQEWRARTKLDKEAVPGTDTVASSLLLGIGQVLTDNLLLDVSFGIGLTRDSPDYIFQITLPLRGR
jgi:hypothetical protein